MKEDLEFDIEGEIFEHFMTLQNFYKIFQDSLGIVQFIFFYCKFIQILQIKVLMENSMFWFILKTNAEPKSLGF